MTAQSQNFKVGKWQKRMSSITFEHILRVTKLSRVFNV